MIKICENLLHWFHSKKPSYQDMSRRVSDQEMRKLYSVLRRVFNESQGLTHEQLTEPRTETIVHKNKNKWRLAAWVFAALCVCYLLYWLARKDPKRPSKRSAG